MPGIKGMRGHPPANSPFVPGHSIQPSPEQRPSSIHLANRQRWAGEMRAALAEGVPASQIVEWIYEAAELARARSDGKVLLQAAELVLMYGVGKPREQLSEKEGIDMLGVIEDIAREMSERTIEGRVEERGEREREEEDNNKEQTSNQQPTIDY